MSQFAKHYRKFFLTVSVTTIVPSFISFKISSISDVAFLDSSASFLISSATTAKPPLPASPALAASIAAFKASKFVWSVMLLIVSTISPIFPTLPERFF